MSALSIALFLFLPALPLSIREHVIALPEEPDGCRDAPVLPQLSSSSTEKVIKNLNKKNKSELSTTVAEHLAKKAAEKNIKKIYFDRGIYKYHGRIKIFAETLRKNGMEF